MMNSGPTAKCRNCGKDSPADSFILDPVYGKMVCQTCVKSRKGPNKIKPGGEEKQMLSGRPVEKIIPNTAAARAMQGMQPQGRTVEKIVPNTAAARAMQTMAKPQPVQGGRSVRNTPDAQEDEQQAVKEKPKGWDKEDEMLERAYASKQQAKAATHGAVVQIDDTHVKYTCKKCKYSFKYNTEKKQPAHCSYCGADIKI